MFLFYIYCAEQWIKMDFIANGDAEIRNGPSKSYWYDVSHPAMDDSHFASICNGFWRYLLIRFYPLVHVWKPNHYFFLIQNIVVFTWRFEFSYDQGCLPFRWYLPPIHSSRRSSSRGSYCFFHGTYRIFASVLYFEFDTFCLWHNKGTCLKFGFHTVSNNRFKKCAVLKY